MVKPQKTATVQKLNATQLPPIDRPDHPLGGIAARRLLNRKNLRRLTGVALIATLALAAGGCSTTSAKHGEKQSPAVLMTIERGATRQAVDALLTVPSRHQFTVRRDDSVIQCLKYHFPKYHNAYLLVFTNSALHKIALTPQYEYVATKEDLARGVQAVWESEDPICMVSTTVDAPVISMAEISYRIENRYRPNRLENFMWGIVLPSGAEAHREWLKSPDGKRHTATVERLRSKFDPERITLGASIQEVENLLGPDLGAHDRTDDADFRYYGSFYQGRNDPELWISIHYEEGKVAGIYTDRYRGNVKMPGVNEETAYLQRLKDYDRLSADDLNHFQKTEQQMIKSNFGIAETYYYRAALRAILGREQEALEDIELAIKKNDSLRRNVSVIQRPWSPADIDRASEEGRRMGRNSYTTTEPVNLRVKLVTDRRFNTLRKLERFQRLLPESPVEPLSQAPPQER